MQQFELSEELVSQIEGLIKADNKEDVSKLVEPLHPADIAEIMNELDTKEAQFLFLLLDEEKAGDVLAEIEEDERQRFIDSFPPEIIAKRFVDNMDTDDAADLVGSMPNEQQQEVLSHMEDLEQAGDIVDLLHYDEDSAGGLMGKELVKVNENWTVLTCLRELSRQAENLDEIFYIYVVDDDNILKGRLSLKKMILSPTSTKIQSIYNPDVTYVTTDEPAESVGRIMQKYDLVAIPVVDHRFIRRNACSLHDFFLRGRHCLIPSNSHVHSCYHRHGGKRGYPVFRHRGKRTCLQHPDIKKHITEYLKRNFMCGHKCLHLFFHHFYPIPLFQPNITCHAHHGNYILIYRDHVRIHVRYSIPVITQ